MWKNETFLKRYKSLLNSMTFQTLESENMDSIEILQNALKSCSLEAYNQLKNDSDFHSINRKPWWTTELSKSRKLLQSTFNQWRSTNFNRDPHNVHYHRYLFARKNFRSLVKRCKSQSTVEHYINIEKVKKIKPKSYWSQIRLAKSSPQKLYTINNKTNTEDITTEFKNHFDTLLNTPRTAQINNTRTNDLLDSLLSDLQEMDEIDFLVNENDLLTAINNLNKDKAYDPFGIKAEHFIHGFTHPSDQNLSFLSLTINRILTSKHFPESLATSHLVPIIKSHRKPISDPNNYRGISLIPILTKLIEQVILQKCPQLKHHADHQYGFSSDGSTLHAEFLINETIQKYNTQNTPVYICSLDAEKAFDSCNWLELFNKLKLKNILPNTVLQFLIKLYSHGEAKIKYNSNISKPFSLSQGVRQGSILSPYLYNIYTEDILQEITNLNVGTFLNPNINTSIIAFADDLILLSPNLKHLQKMISLCQEKGGNIGLKFNDTKTQFIVSGNCPIDNPSISMNDKSISPQKTLKHLGFLWDTKSKKITLAKHQENRIQELWAVTSSLISSGVRKMHPN
eukprot:TCONS_00012144-protein